MKAIVASAAESVRELHDLWGWYLALGIFLIIAGAYVVYAGTAGTIASVIALGAILCVAGVAQIITAFMTRNAGHLVLLLLAGALDVVIGIMIAQHPNAGAAVITLLVAVFLVFSGIFRFIAALWFQFPHYVWISLGGIASAALGVLLWYQWPSSASWFLGLAVGLSFVAAGAAWCAFAVNLKRQVGV